MANLSMGGRVNFGILREIARKEFLECLDTCQGTKAIVWDDQLTGPFNAVAEYEHLKEHDVTRMFPLRSGNLPPASVQNVIFLVRPRLALMDIIAENARNEEKGNSKRELHLVFVPRKSLLCEKRLQDSGVYGNFSSIREYCLDFFVFEKDLLTMEIEYSFKECHLEGDTTSAYHMAKALMALQAIYGIIPSVYGKGKTAKQVYDLMLRMRRELCGTEPTVTPQIDCLLLIDRNVDLISPLATQLTFEGLIDEIFTISCGIVKLPSSKFGETDEEGKPQAISVEPKQIMLSSKEDLYAEIRDKNFNAVGPILSKKAKIIAAQLEERHQAKSIPDFKKFVGKLPTIHADKRSLATQTSIAELVKEVTDSDTFLESLQVEQEFLNGHETDKANTYIEDCIARQEPLLKVLRLLCLQSVTNNGLKPKLLDSYRREVIQTYGFQHFLTLQNLEKAGLLCAQGQRNYSVIRKTLRLTVDEVNELNPTDISYVHSGYAPLSVRLAQFLAKPGWRAITDVLHLLPGPTVEESQQVPYGLRKRRGSGTSIQSSSDDQRVTLVVFLGGCTFAEIAALRFLSQQEDYPTEYVIATTKLINGTSFVKSLMETLQPNSA